MADLATDLGNLKSAVADVATDVTDVAADLKDLRDKLAAGGTITPDQIKTLEDAVSGLQAAHQGLRAAIGTPTPTPTGAAAQGQPGQPQTTRFPSS